MEFVKRFKANLCSVGMYQIMISCGIKLKSSMLAMGVTLNFFGTTDLKRKAL